MMSTKEQNALLAIFGKLRKKDRVFLLALANSLKGKGKYRNQMDGEANSTISKQADCISRFGREVAR